MLILDVYTGTHITVRIFSYNYLQPYYTLVAEMKYFFRACRYLGYDKNKKRNKDKV